MKQVMIYKGETFLRDVPSPVCGKSSVYVDTVFSCVSAGTEATSVKGSGESLLHKAITRPATAMRFAKMILSKGPGYVMNTVKTKTSYGFGNPIGYTASGIVRKVGSDVTQFRAGDRVAIYGAKYAYHASENLAPANMIVPVPDNVSLEDAATGALGGIAMQGVHRLNPRPGDTVLVVGMGLIGQLTIQILLSYNCKVICSDINRERLSVYDGTERVNAINGNEPEFVEKVKMLNGGKETDGAIFTAATGSSAPLSQCFQCIRKKGTCVLVGVSGMNLDRNDLYPKELDFLISTSYGPGRYDPRYEEAGMDYPAKYVPFTEQRNIEEYLRLLSEKKISLEKLSRNICPADECAKPFAAIVSGKAAMIELIDYTGCGREETHKVIRKHTEKKTGVIEVALAGTGSYAKNMHLPNLAALPDKYHIRAIMNRSGVPAVALAEQYDADYSTNDYADILNDPEIDMVFICTRHDSHVELAVKALKAGKHVLVEKPPALDADSLNRVLSAAKESGCIYTVGYNRRFSKYAKQIKKTLAGRKGAITLRYLMCAGYIPYDHWVHNEGGGRIIGEGCHIIDLIFFLMGTDVESVDVKKVGKSDGYYRTSDNVVTTLKFGDGSIAVFEYISLGASGYPKETMDIFFDGKHIALTDYMKLSGTEQKQSSETQDKGQADMLRDIYDVWSCKAQEVIPLHELEATSQMTFLIEKANSTGAPYRLNEK